MSDSVQIAFVSLVVALAAASLLVWLVVFARLRAGQPLLVAEPREPVPWRAIDLYFILILYLALQFACAKLVMGWGGIAPRDAADDYPLAAVLLSNALANALLIGLASVYLRLRCGPKGGDLGFLPWRPGKDLRLGLLTFLAALVPVFSIQYALTRLVPTEHPVQELLTKDSSPRMLVLCAVTAIVVAPLAEEFLFRVLLQGWMESVAISRRQRRNESASFVAPGPAAADVASAREAPATVEVKPLNSTNPYASPQQASARAEQPDVRPAPPLMPLPIVFSSLIFAAVHLGHGPDPIPLFVLALMLGYLYQKTHRIWPSLVVHACLNAWSLTVLWLSLRMGWGTQ
jgi:membrane protease YdiL (CAAX protease family)